MNGLPLLPTSSGGARFDITLAGEINLDLILSGLPVEMPLEREILATGFTATLGSSSAILAHNMAVLGASVGFITCVGGDPLGQLALERLRESGTDLSRVVQGRGETGTGVTLLLPHGRNRHILTYPGTMAELTCADLDVEYLSGSRHFHLSSLFLQTGLHAGLPALLKTLKERGLVISLDTNDDPANRWDGVLHDVLPLVDILLPNEDELLRMVGTSTLADALERMGALVPLLVVKRGALGATVYQGGVRSEIAPVAVEPVDTIGAGDSFNAGFLTAYLRGHSAEVSAAFGNVTGALSALRSGGTEAFRDASLRDGYLRDQSPGDLYLP